MNKRHRGQKVRSMGSREMATFARNLRTLLLARGNGSELSLSSALGISVEELRGWAAGCRMPSRRMVHQVARWAGLSQSVDLTHDVMLELEKRNARTIRTAWIDSILRLSATEVLELKPGLDKILITKE